MRLIEGIPKRDFLNCSYLSYGFFSIIINRNIYFLNVLKLKTIIDVL